ncbi:murein biosynthesis integral membrane protein MurJ [Cryobacterium soli]|uniref:murein biosynthesis integral membrane protein MurJ n=1 Tax=Cryobacterium soli TaxID=2220095 RepID=UPI0013C422C4|nr:lipid II flippase MurJ [Cryobacterium soli]
MSVRRSIGSMMVATFVSRGLGFVKTMLLVAAIGATSAYAGGQAFETANTAPTYLFALIAGGVLGAVLVPQIVRNLDAGPVGRENTDRLLTVVLVGGAAATLLLTLCAPAIVGIYTVGWSDEWRTLATSMAYWCLPQVFFLIAFAVLSQMLNARGVFGAPAWAPAVSNLIGIAGILVFLLALPSGLDDAASWSPLMIAVLAGSATLAIAVQALLLIIPLRRIGFRMRFRWGFGGLGQMSTLAGWTLLGVVAGQAAYLVTANVANNAGQTLYGLHVEGASLNSLSTAYLLVLLPHGIVTVSLTTALYTRMSGLAGRNDLAETDKLSSVATRPVAYVSIAAAALFVAVGPLLTQLIFSSAVVGHVLAVLSLGLVGFSQAYVLNRTSFALQDARGPFCTQLVIAGLSAAGSAAALLLPPEFTVLGIAAGISVANLAGWLTAHLALRRSFRMRGHLPARRPHEALYYLRLFAAAAVSAGAGSILLSVVGTPAGFVARAALLAGAGAGVAGIFAGFARLLGDRSWDGIRRR